MRSSLGFHTMSLSLPLDDGEHSELIHDFSCYNNKNHSFRMYFVDKNKKSHSYRYSPGYDYIPLDLRIAFVKYEGITWNLRYSGITHTPFVHVQINPKFLAGFTDYITAANLDDMNLAGAQFNAISRGISPLLRTFNDYHITRLDYCVNFALDELTPGCSAEQMINLIKRSNVPSRFKEWGTYDEVSHRFKTKPSSFYLTNGSANLNCYSKYMKLVEQQEQNKERGYEPIPQHVLDDSRHIIRFEVQFKYHKMYRLSRTSEKPEEDTPTNQYRTLLDPAMCENVIKSYYARSIGYGHWYSLTEAISRVQATSYNAQKKERLCDALRRINKCRSVEQAKATLNDRELAAFKLTLKELSDIGVNPVTIPREWGLPCIHNLLEEFYARRKAEEDEMFCRMLAELNKK